jgi:hypothetical protein
MIHEFMPNIFKAIKLLSEAAFNNVADWMRLVFPIFDEWIQAHAICFLNHEKVPVSQAVFDRPTGEDPEVTENTVQDLQDWGGGVVRYHMTRYRLKLAGGAAVATGADLLGMVRIEELVDAVVTAVSFGRRRKKKTQMRPPRKWIPTEGES